MLIHGLIIALLIVLSLLGLWRGVRGGLLALVGTMLAAVLVDLWQERWALWVRGQLRPENPTEVTVWLTLLVFLTVALLVGYGSNVLLPRANPPQRPSAFDRMMGGLVGLLNGALIVGYLLRYMRESLADDDFAALLGGAPLAALLVAWLPWFMLALVIATGMVVLVRMLFWVGRRMMARPAPAPAPKTGTPVGAPADKASPPSPAPAPPAATPAPPAQAAVSDKRFLNRMTGRTGDPPKK